MKFFRLTDEFRDLMTDIPERLDMRYARFIAESGAQDSFGCRKRYLKLAEPLSDEAVLEVKSIHHSFERFLGGEPFELALSIYRNGGGQVKYFFEEGDVVYMSEAVLYTIAYGKWLNLREPIYGVNDIPGNSTVFIIKSDGSMAIYQAAELKYPKL